MEAFARLLYQEIGLDPASIGMPAIERAVRLRLAACRESSTDAYLQRLRNDREEVQALVESVVVSETWFFRDPKAFGVIAERFRQATGKLFFLCLPCSTGEEPYSLAMTLLDAGIPAERFHIDAVDVSDRVLAHARTGIYGRNSFRGRDLAFRDRHFIARQAGWAIAPAIRKLVHFHRGNLLDDTAVPHGRTYDAIFCRNLLIYFDVATQKRAISELDRHLTSQGLLCVGPAETGLLAAHDFTHTRISLAFAFTKGKTAPVAKPVASTSAKKRVAPHPAPAKSRPAPRAVTPPTPPAPSTPLPDLNEALRLADEGQLDRVAAICHDYLRIAGASAQAYYLLGLVSDTAKREEEAAAHYRRALYLDPQHHDTLLHYSLLVSRRGDTAAAQALRRRAKRSTEATAP